MENPSTKEDGANLVSTRHSIDLPPSQTKENAPALDSNPTHKPTFSHGPAPSIVRGASSAATESHPSGTLNRTRAPTAQSRPQLSARKFITERPTPISRQSRFRPKRGHTALNTAAWRSDSESDSSSSSSEDDMCGSSQRLPTATSKSSAKNKPHAGSLTKKDARRQNTDEQHFSKFSVGNDNFKTRGKVSKTSGRLNISVNEKSNHGYLVKALGATLQNHLKPSREPGDADVEPRSLSPLHKEDSEKAEPSTKPPLPKEELSQRRSLLTRLSTLKAVPVTGKKSIPILNLVIMVIGSRGDIQPFLKLGKLLKEEHGHRVRIATHPAFKDFVERDSGLEFFSVGGDPAELMAFMVKNPGLIPSISTVKAGEIGRKRDSMFEMFQGFWRACINATDDENDVSNRKMMGDKHPFVADAIIANPPSFAHIHCAERLGIPLHLMFTFPYSPTQQFPHPLANIKKSNVDTDYTNFISYPLVEMMTWQGLGDLVNRFRVKTLGLEPVSTLWAPGQLFRLKVPYTYLWSPGLIPKPADWGPEIDIAGFVFLDLASAFQPPESLTKFLEAGEPPVYIGFGSIVVDDPDKFTAIIFEAVKKAGVRALVSKGWGGLGDEGNTPENIYMLENTPHDWLFPRVSAVVHHGGAGTTAIGLKCGKPTMIVPFFGDQPFWGAMVAKAGAGAHAPIPYKNLSVHAFAEGIIQCLSPEAKSSAQILAKNIAAEGDGASNAIQSFHNHLELQGERTMRCSIFVDRVAVWELKKTSLRLSALAAELLVEKKYIKWQSLRLIRHHDWNDFEGPGEPLTGGGAAIISSATGVVKGVGGVPLRWVKSYRKREKYTRGKEGGKKTSKPSQTNIEKDQPTVQAEKAQKVHHETSVSSNGAGIHTSGASDEDETLFNSDDSKNNIAQDMAADTGTGLARTGEALAKVPMDLALAVAQGFHNAPRLYGDSTVRTPIRISGIQSGLRAAGEEFTFGIYDGVTGLFLQPYNGAKAGGTLGFVKGLGKGFGGFVLKDLAAIIGPIGYTMKGVHKEIVKGKKLTAFIRQARTLQGEKDMRTLNVVDREASSRKIDTSWKLLEEIWHEVDLAKEEGLKSRVAIMKRKRQMTKEGKFESVETTRKAFIEWKEERAALMEVRSGGGGAAGE